LLASSIPWLACSSVSPKKKLNSKWLFHGILGPVLGKKKGKKVQVESSFKFLTKILVLFAVIILGLQLLLLLHPTSSACSSSSPKLYSHGLGCPNNSFGCGLGMPERSTSLDPQLGKRKGSLLVVIQAIKIPCILINMCHSTTILVACRDSRR
jgi:hypothetical protein